MPIDPPGQTRQPAAARAFLWAVVGIVIINLVLFAWLVLIPASDKASVPQGATGAAETNTSKAAVP